MTANTIIPDVSMPALRALATAAPEGASRLMRVYQEQYRLLHQLEVMPELRLGHIETASAEEAMSAIKVGAILNDICFVSLATQSKSLNVHWLAPQGIRNLLGTDRFFVRIPPNPPPALKEAIEKSQVTIGFVMPNDEPSEKVLKDLGPLIEHCGVVPRPARSLIYLKETLPTGQRNWELIETPLGETLETWDLRTADQTQPKPLSIPIQTNRNILQSERVLFNVTLPFVENVSNVNLAKIMLDEMDILLEFRTSLRAVIENEATKNRSPAQILNDIVRPNIARLERRFRHVVNMGRLKMAGAALSTASLSLVSYMHTGFAEAVVPLLGAGGLVYGAQEYVSRSKELETLKDEPFYLLWKIARRETK